MTAGTVLQSTPVDEVTGKDPEGDPPDFAFNHASVTGMLWHLHGHSRPDLGMAVSQAARFSFALSSVMNWHCGPHKIPVSVDLEDSIIGLRSTVLASLQVVPDHAELRCSSSHCSATVHETN